MKRLAIYGILTGLFISAWMYAEYLLGFHANEVWHYTRFVVLIFTIAGLYLGLKAYRDQDKAGKINYWETVFAGIQISIFTGLVTAIFTLLYHKFINPEFANFIVEANSQLLEVKGATAENLRQNAELIRQKYRPWPQALQAFGVFVAAGGMFSLILAGILKSRRMTD